MIRDNGHNHDDYLFGMTVMPNCPACKLHSPGECSAKCTAEKHEPVRRHAANLAECWCEPVRLPGGGVFVHRWIA